MVILKEQIQKLKQIAQQLQDDKVQLKDQIKTLEAINTKFKSQLD